MAGEDGTRRSDRHDRPVNLRDATDADLPAIVAIANDAIAGSVAHFGLLPWTVEQARADFAGRSPMHPWVVADDGGVLGYAKAGQWKPRGAYAWTVEVGVYVHRDARGRGVGTSLYAALLPKLDAAGVRHAVAGIVLPNEPSVRLHEAFGFEPVGVFPTMGFKHGAWHAVGYWSRVVGDGPPEGA
jgi:L-amino acid N-acyltransferase YncA